MDISAAFGKVFVTDSGEEYGIIRKTDLRTIEGKEAIAEDECGNHFLTSPSAIYFLDHETNEEYLLSSSLTEFMEKCTIPSKSTLKPSEVRSAWIDPTFAKSLGIEAPEDGKIK
jgi:hypothetical protein